MSNPQKIILQDSQIFYTTSDGFIAFLFIMANIPRVLQLNRKFNAVKRTKSPVKTKKNNVEFLYKKSIALHVFAFPLLSFLVA